MARRITRFSMGAITSGRRPSFPLSFGGAIPTSPRNSNVPAFNRRANLSRLLTQFSSKHLILRCVSSLAEVKPLDLTAHQARCSTNLDLSRLFKSTEAFRAVVWGLSISPPRPSSRFDPQGSEGALCIPRVRPEPRKQLPPGPRRQHLRRSLRARPPRASRS